ncbi:hypothetical protein CCB81_12915 [Armatimonadetes bacterium Uphvl-Ar2]|nr:hypothetical protein CCB81_12915 [Armatimonadetes bacterium Uphvl-Ar2]
MKLVVNAIPNFLAAFLVFYRTQSGLPPFFGTWFGAVGAAFGDGQTGFLVPPLLIQAWAFTVGLGFISALALSATQTEGATSRLRHAHLIARHVYLWTLACAIPYWAFPFSFILAIAIPGALALSVSALVVLATCIFTRMPISAARFKKETRYVSWWILTLVALEALGVALIGGS